MKKFLKKCTAIMLFAVMLISTIGTAVYADSEGIIVPESDEEEAANGIMLAGAGTLPTYDQYFDFGDVGSYLKQNFSSKYESTAYCSGIISKSYGSNLVTKTDTNYNPAAGNGLNCTGFVARVLYAATTGSDAYPGDAAFNSFFVSHGFADWYMKHPTAAYHGKAIENAVQTMGAFIVGTGTAVDAPASNPATRSNVLYYKYTSYDAMIAGVESLRKQGILTDGSIIASQPIFSSGSTDSYGNAWDNHIGFYYNPNNVEITSTALVYANATHITNGLGSTAIGSATQLSNICSKADNCYWFVYPASGSKLDPIRTLLKKKDAITGESMPQGDGSLAGAEFTVKYYENETASGTPSRTWIFATNEFGVLRLNDSAKISGDELYKNNNGIVSIPVGSISIEETKSPKGYLKSDTVLKIGFILEGDRIVKKDLTTGQQISSTTSVDNVADLDVTLKEHPIYGGASFQKYDAETENEAQGSSTLEGAVIDIYNESDSDVTVEGVKYAKGQKVLSLTTDKEGKCSTAADALPYGTYMAKESSPSEGYTLNEDWSVTFQIRENGVVVDTANDAVVNADSNKSGVVSSSGISGSGYGLPEYIKRANLALAKLDEDGETMGNIPFLIELIDKNGDTVESHVIVTDEKGTLNTATRTTDSSKTNCLDRYADNGVFTDESKLTADTNIWFGADKKTASGSGALIYGNYRIAELKCKANEGHDLLTKEIFVTNEPGDLFINGQTYTVTFVNLLMDIKSVLTDNESGTNIVTVGDKVTVTDTISYGHLKSSGKYRLTTDIYYIGRNGEAEKIGTKTKDFSPEKTGNLDTVNGKISNEVTVNTAELEGGKICAVATISRINGKNVTVVAAHNEAMNEESQELYVPYMATVASDGETNDHVGAESEKSSVTDVVTYENLCDGKSYELEGTLRYADTGEEVLDEDGNEYTVSKTFKCSWSAEEETEIKGEVIVPRNGTITMPSFNLDATDLKGRTLVVTEVLTEIDAEKVILEHNDLSDEDQSIHYIEVTTAAKDVNTDTRTAYVGTTTISDEVTMKNLVVGQSYTLTGDLVYKEDGTDANGIEHKKGDVIATHVPVTFTADQSEMVITLDYAVNSSALSGMSGVVFESVWHNSSEVAKHHDYEADSQTPNWPSVKTTAVDKESGIHSGLIREDASVIDTVVLENLTIGDKYYVEGNLMTKDGENFLVDGKPLTVKSDVFTAKEKSQTIEIEFSFKASELKGQSLVAFEKLIFVGEDEGKEDGEESGKKEVEVARHEDLTDKSQTVDYVDVLVQTHAKDGVTGTNEGYAEQDMTIDVIDSVSYDGVIVGHEYTINGTLMDKETKNILVGPNGETYTATATFTAEETNGTIDLIFEVPAAVLIGKKVVAFEKILQEGLEVGSHEDITDEDQTVSYPEIKTTATTSAGKKSDYSSQKFTVIDEVKYQGLTPGNIYTIKGTLMDKETGKAITVSGKEVTASASLTPEEISGSINITFVFDSTAYAGHALVAFEEIYNAGGSLIAAHKDLTDADQTVTTLVVPGSKVIVPKTGDENGKTVIILISVMAAAVLVVGGMLINKKKNTR